MPLIRIRNIIAVIACLRMLTSVEAQDLSPAELKYKADMEQILSSEDPDTMKARIVWNIMDNVSYYASSLPIEFAHKTIAILDQPFESEWRGTFEHRLGVMYINTGFLELSMLHTRNAIRCFQEADLPQKEARSHGLIRYLFSESQEYDSSIYHCYQALNIYERLNDIQGIGETYNDLAGTLISTGNYADALAFAEKGIPILEKGTSMFEYVLILDKKAQCLFALGDHGGAVKFESQAINLADPQDPTIDSTTSANLLQTRAGFYKDMGEYDKALEDIRLANQYISSAGNEYWQRVSDITSAEIFMKQHNYAAAKQLHLAMLHIPVVDSSAYVGDWEDNASSLAEIYHALDMSDSAYYYLKLSNAFSRAKLANATSRQMEALKTQYETEQKERIIATQETRIRQQKRVQVLSWSLSGALVLGLGGIGIFFMANKRRRKELEILNRKLDARIVQNEVLLKEIHHRVKNNLQTVSSLLNLQSDSITDHSALEAVGDSQSRVRSMALIHQKLYMNENLAAIDMLDYFESMGEAILQSFGSRAALINYKVEMEKLELDIDTAIPLGLITNELVTNSLKHAFPEGQTGNVIVGLKKSADNELVLSVTDDGVASPNPGKSTSGTGFGTRLVELLAMQLDGRVIRTFQNGTSVSLHFPGHAIVN